MAERRQAQRREPITVVVRERDVEARPLPWFKRNDLGNEIMNQYAEILNSALQSYTNNEDIPIPKLSIHLNDKLLDPEVVVAMGYPDAYEADKDFFHELEYPELLELIYASLEVNELQSLREIVDPNALTPTNDGSSSLPGMEIMETDTQNPQSTPDSFSEVSPETQSSI